MSKVTGFRCDICHTEYIDEKSEGSVSLTTKHGTYYIEDCCLDCGQDIDEIFEKLDVQQPARGGSDKSDNAD